MKISWSLPSRQQQCAILLCFLFVSRSATGFGVEIPVEHSFGGDFSPAGTLQGSLFESTSSRGDILTLFRKELDASQQEALARLVKSNGLYRIRIAATPLLQDGSKLLTSIPARCLAASGFQEHLQVHASATGEIVGFNYDFARSPCTSASRGHSLPADLNFPEASQVPVWLPAAAPVLRKPESLLADGGASFGSRQGGNQQGAAGGKRAPGGDGGEQPPEDNRHWLLKNWMIVVPLAFVAVNVLGQVMGPLDAPGAPGGAPPAAAPRRR